MTIWRACKRERGCNFETYFRQKRKRGLEGLRVKQYELAMKGDRVMLIWTGKQWLGQKEPRTVHEVSGPKGGPVTVNVDDVLDLTKLSGPELEAYEVLLRKAAGKGASR